MARNIGYFTNASTYASSITANNAALVRDLSLTATGHCTWSRERVWNTSAKSPRYPLCCKCGRVSQRNRITSILPLLQVLLLPSSFLFLIVSRRRLLALRGVRKTATFLQSTLPGDFRGFFASATDPVVLRCPYFLFWIFFLLFFTAWT